MRALVDTSYAAAVGKFVDLFRRKKIKCTPAAATHYCYYYC